MVRQSQPHFRQEKTRVTKPESFQVGKPVGAYGHIQVVIEIKTELRVRVYGRY